jgi:hypothetical protein
MFFLGSRPHAGETFPAARTSLRAHQDAIDKTTPRIETALDS